jgi:hypothetical protein
MKNKLKKIRRDIHQQHLILALGTIIEKEGTQKPKERISASIECPACKGRLSYVISPYNGHIWGQCNTSGCLSWRQ